MVSELLYQWGDEGFQKHITTLRGFYQERRDVMLKAAEKHLSGKVRKFLCYIVISFVQKS